jgi:peptidyl-dipeptidase Dcp
MAKSNKSFNAKASSNPLINPKDLPYGAPDFDSVKAEHLEPAIDWALDELLSNINAIKNNDDLPTFENTIEALENASEELSRVMSVFHVLSMTN